MPRHENDPRVSATNGVDPEYDGPAAKPIDPATGQHGSYFILSAKERAKGYVRPIRRAYRHVGPQQRKGTAMRDLTPGEQERYATCGYAKFESYPESEAPVVGRFWTQAQLDAMNGCGNVTTMGRSIAETYARDPAFYTSTFCVHCGVHLPIDEFVWADDGSRVGS